MREFFIQGGPLMWPLLLCSLVSVAVLVERSWFWARLGMARRDALVEQVLELAAGGRRDAAARGAEGAGDPALRVLAAGLRRSDHGAGEHMQAAAEDELAAMRRGMIVMDTIVTVAPLLGILGTVLGIIEAFRMLSGGSSIQEPQHVVSGLAQALITTAAGLIVAIGTVVPYNFFRGRIAAAGRRMERAATLLEAAAAGPPGREAPHAD